jgi:hypothetical protein
MRPIRIMYKGETIQVWQEPNGLWKSGVVALGESEDKFLIFELEEDFDSPESAIDAAMKSVDEDEDEF